jgi:uncharacterized membrane protein
MSSFASRRRNVPWIHRWSRPLIGAIAGLGILNTAYLTITKLANSKAVCPTEGCEQVLSSPYATVFGLPLALFGLLAYLTMAALALGPLLLRSDDQKQLRATVEKWSWLGLFVVATAMTVFSGYLMFIMFSQFVAKYGPGGLCYFCLASAIFATSMFVLTLVGHEWEDIGQLLFTGLLVLMVTLVGTLAVYAPIYSPKPGEDPSTQLRSADGQVFFTVKNISGQAEIELARHLKQIGAKMYAAYWCPHCYEQKELFGKEALKDLPYIECAPDGVNPQTPLCKEVAPKVEQQTGQPFGFPAWEINGKYYPGTQSLEELAKVSGYTGPRDFKNAP